VKLTPFMLKRYLFLTILLITCHYANSQFLMDMVDTTTDMGKGMLGIYRKFDNVRIGGYIQPQWQLTQAAGAKTYSGGDFSLYSNNRFMLRRGRIRFDYIHFTDNKGPSLQFVFQFDGTERGVFIRDFWGRVFENKFKLFAFTAGMFARPFSYELNLSSSDRESPERGRMSQILMKTERDLGVMISFEPRKKDGPLHFLKWDAGLFNGQGLSTTTDFDSRKDFISRLGIKPVNLSKNILISAAVSYLDGGMLQHTKYIYRTRSYNGLIEYVVDSSISNLNKIAPRKYKGADIQVKIKENKWTTELRGEVIMGKQTATFNSSETPGALLNGSEGHYIRNFSGAYFYVLQTIELKHQLVIKYDWYDPNIDTRGKAINTSGNFNAADIKYSTLGFGYNYFVTPNLKLVLWYDIIRNEKTSLPGFEKDLRDNVFTCRLQFRF